MGCISAESGSAYLVSYKREAYFDLDEEGVNNIASSLISPNMISKSFLFILCIVWQCCMSWLLTSSSVSPLAT